MEEDLTDASDVVETIQRLLNANHALSRAEALETQQLAEMLKVAVKYGTAKLVAETAMSPMLQHHSSRLPSSEVVHRKAKQTEEFLVRNHFVRCTLPDGRVETRVVLHDPVPLKRRKSAHAIVDVLRGNWKTGRQLGHFCAMESYRFGRFALSALECIWRQVRAADAPCHDCMPPGLPADVFRLTEFVIVGGCAAHDVHNAFRWSLFFQVRDLGLLGNAHVTVNLQQCFQHIP